VQGPGEVKVMDNKNLNFLQHIFWPLKNLFGGINSNYACAYANWFKVNTENDRFVWVPPSGYVANLMIKTDMNFFPWYAPAGLTRGILTGVLDISINPSQKQRDLLYKNGINPTVYWPGDGYVVWGQKTLQRKPSAFDRINVRRMFLWCEKAVLQLSKYFVFEQNTSFTRNRLKAAINPVLGFAKSNEGIYDYLIVCDDRNNTAESIDRNELIVDIYIKPVRVAEYILINFIATRTGQRFEELI
jgi:phage tail sheath protein FI